MSGIHKALIALQALSAAAIVLATPSCSGTRPADSPKAAAEGPTAGRILVVTAVQAVTRPISASVQATGSFVAMETSDVAPEAAGRVVETPVNVGDFVKQGQVLANALLAVCSPNYSAGPKRATNNRLDQRRDCRSSAAASRPPARIPPSAATAP